MKILVIDNELNVRESFVNLIIKTCPEITEITQANGVKTGIAAIKENKPDLVFLDVEMDDGTGMDLLSQLDKIEFQLVFITAFNKYAVDAFKFSAIDFLLKPVASTDLFRSIERAKSRIQTNNLSLQLSVLQESLQSLKSTDKKIVLNDSESIHFVKVSDIVRCEASGAYTKFIFSPKREILVSSSLKEYEELLIPYGFSRVHHSHVINLKKIIRFDRKDGGVLVLDNNDIVPISKRKKDELAQIINQL